MDTNVKASVRKLESVAILDMKGEVSSFADEILNTLVNTTIAEGFQKIVFNFSEVSYINSSGIAVLIGMITNLSSKGIFFQVYGLTPHFKKIFRMIGLTQYVKIFSTEEEAIAAF
jgi:anti-anti-sigma factor